MITGFALFLVLLASFIAYAMVRLKPRRGKTLANLEELYAVLRRLPYQWHLDDGRIRVSFNGHTYCPLTAACKAHAGSRFHSNLAPCAGLRLGLKFPLRYDIMKAADRLATFNPQIRATLLNIAGLQENMSC